VVVLGGARFSLRGHGWAHGFPGNIRGNYLRVRATRARGGGQRIRPLGAYRSNGSRHCTAVSQGWQHRLRRVGDVVGEHLAVGINGAQRLYAKNGAQRLYAKDAVRSAASKRFR
jgi:hypothetical protein